MDEFKSGKDLDDDEKLKKTLGFRISKNLLERLAKYRDHCAKKTPGQVGMGDVSRSLIDEGLKKRGF